MIDFDVSSDDPEDRQLVTRYWAMDSAGKFVEPMTSILPYREISKAPQLVKYINKISEARDLNHFCSLCGCSAVVHSRADVKPRMSIAARVCATCREAEEREHQKAIEEAKAELTKRLAQIEARNLEESCNYGAIPDDLALLLIALERAINPRLLHGSFMRSDCRNLAASGNGQWIKRLWEARLVVDLPSKAARDAYFIKQEAVWHYSDKIAYVLVPDTLLGKNEEAFAVLTERDFDNHQLIRQLWFDYAVSECMTYLLDQCITHGLETAQEDDDAIRSTLSTALNIYSVAQLWSVIWKIVRDAAALSARPYYSKAKAAATIPGKIKRNLEQVARASGTPPSWTRPPHQPAGTLGDVFYEYFTFDDNTPGTLVHEMFCDPGDASEVDPPAEVIEHLTRTLMRQALSMDVSADVMLCFAQRIRTGDDALAALNAVQVAYPRLGDAG